MLVTVTDGKVTRVQGNPDHPFTRGRLCVEMNDYEMRVYSPDRVLHPLKRTGPKGSGQFERVSWDAALAEIKDRWTGIISEHGAKAILPYSYLGTEASSTASKWLIRSSTGWARRSPNGHSAIPDRSPPMQ